MSSVHGGKIVWCLLSTVAKKCGVFCSPWQKGVVSFVHPGKKCLVSFGSGVFCPAPRIDQYITIMETVQANLDMSNLLTIMHKMSRIVRKPAFCICENKDADQLRSNCEADQRLCFRYMYSATSVLSKSEFSSLLSSSMVVQPGLCQTWSEPPKTVFSQRGSNVSRKHCLC